MRGIGGVKDHSSGNYSRSRQPVLAAAENDHRDDDKCGVPSRSRVTETRAVADVYPKHSQASLQMATVW